MTKRHNPEDVAIIIPARMESSRFPGKAMADARGKPLIQWAVEAAKASQLAECKAVVTDSVEIYNWCGENDVHSVLMQQRTYATGSDRVFGATEFLRGFGRGPFKVVVNLQCDEPDITGEDLDRLIEEVVTHRRPVVTYAFELTDPIDLIAHNIVKVIVDHNGDAIYFSRLALSGAHLIHVGVYAYRMNELRSFANRPQSSLEKAEDLEQLRLIEVGVPIRVLDLGRPVTSINTTGDLQTWNAR